MNPMLLLMALLALSYVGSVVVGGRRQRAGAGLASGIEYVTLGFVLGPHALGVLGHDLLLNFEPVAHVALGWLALVIGLDVAPRRGRLPSVGGLVFGVVSSVFTMVAVAGAVWLVLGHAARPLALLDRVIFAGAVGGTCAETARAAVFAAVERQHAEGPLTSLLREGTRGQEAVPLVVAAVLFSMAPGEHARSDLPVWGWVLATLALGVVLGAMIAAHPGPVERPEGTVLSGETWGLLIGTSMLGIGLSVRLGLSSPTTLFVMGVTTAALSRHGGALRDLVVPIERPVLLPALVLAGAHIEFRALQGLGWVVAAALLARLLAKQLIGGLLHTRPSARRAGPLLGLALLPTGALSLCVGLAFALRFPGALGDAILAVSAAACLAGELLGPVTLRRVLRTAGEVEPSPKSLASGAPQGPRAAEGVVS